MVKMSVQLRGDTALKIGMSTLQQVWYFSLDCVEKEFLAVVALNLYGAVYEAREVLPTVDLTVIMKGMAARKLKLFTKGATLGTDCVIPYERQNLRELDTANCLTFVQTSQISRQSLMTIVEHFPVAKAHVRKAAAIYTLKAAFRQYFKAYKDMEVRTMSGDGDLNSFCAGKGRVPDRSRASRRYGRRSRKRRLIKASTSRTSSRRSSARRMARDSTSREARAMWRPIARSRGSCACAESAGLAEAGRLWMECSKRR